MKSSANASRAPLTATLISSILIASALSGCGSSRVKRLQPVYVLDGAHVKVLPRSEWGEATNTTARQVFRVTDIWLERVRKLELSEAGL